MPFLGDCYDSLTNLIFEDGSPNTAHTMIAKDKEQVKLPKIFVMAGAVESWLNDLTEAMKYCIKKEMHDSKLKQPQIGMSRNLDIYGCLTILLKLY